MAFDQITKLIVRGTLAEGRPRAAGAVLPLLALREQRGAFNLFNDTNSLLAVSALVAIVVLGVYYLFPRRRPLVARLGLALILGGAVGNLLDRVYQGSVTDFINFNEFPAFNVADSGINVGVVLILVTLVVRDATRSAPHR